ncbi:MULTISPECIES: hypothetical protein [unclassified Sporolactobacillus]|nr:hypothetical protein [Sporolactobacillus sp. CQH2019]MDD9149635.1 hypothetical protein [Sporolactobacillus sp. CQH2019]
MEKFSYLMGAPTAIFEIAIIAAPHNKASSMIQDEFSGRKATAHI